MIFFVTFVCKNFIRCGFKSENKVFDLISMAPRVFLGPSTKRQPKKLFDAPVVHFFTYAHLSQVPETNDFLCIHQLRLRFPLLAVYNLLLSTLISIIVPMLVTHTNAARCILYFMCVVRVRPLTQGQSLR